MNTDLGGSVFFPPSAERWAELEEDDEFDYDGPEWVARYMNGYACARCGTAELAVEDVRRLVKAERSDLPDAGQTCPACGGACLGPRPLEVEGTPGTLLAFLRPQLGATLRATLCGACGRVWLALYPRDIASRKALARGFADGGACPLCGSGRLRVTRIDAPHAGFAHLFDAGPDPSDAGGADAGEAGAGEAGGAITPLLAAVCDSCGEASVRIGATSADE